MSYTRLSAGQKMKLLTLTLCLTVLIPVEISADHELSLLKELRDYLADRLHLNKRVIYDETTSKEDYVALIKNARKIAKDRVAEYEILKATRSEEVAASQQLLNNQHRQKKDSYAHEINALEREELLIEIEKAVNTDNTGTYVTVFDLTQYDNFNQAYEETVPGHFCSVRQMTCSTTKKYRSEDGTCNNLVNYLWGSTYQSQLRLQPPKYEDGIREPRTLSKIDGSILTSPRIISNTFLAANDSDPQTTSDTVMLMAWGQFLAHDMVLTPESSAPGDCCVSEEDAGVECFSFAVPRDDRRFRRMLCMNFTRSSPGPLLQTDCLPEPRQQINQITAFIDASNVYGSSEEETDALRNKTTDGTLTAYLNLTANKLLPADLDSACNITDPDIYYCFKAGDERVNTVPNLIMMHLMFAREHNRIVKILDEYHSGWGEKKKFQEARKIVGALMQHITYSEYLPKILSQAYMDSNGLGNTANDPYDTSVNPGIINGYGSAAGRFGHSQIKNHQSYWNLDYKQTRTTRLRHIFEDPAMVQDDDGGKVPALARWMSSDRGMEVDRHFEEEVRNWLFFDLDLSALNIQRGRDHGLPSYTEWRTFCGLSAINSWDDMSDHTTESVELLKTLYLSPIDVDFYVGGISEIHVPGASVGPTFACVINKQFEALKKGDRFWYERNDSIDSVVGLSSDQIAAIKGVTLATVMCNNLGITKVQPDVFQVISESNALQDCSNYNFDLTPWE